jgi:hypothetical protein
MTASVVEVSVNTMRHDFLSISQSDATWLASIERDRAAVLPDADSAAAERRDKAGPLRKPEGREPMSLQPEYASPIFRPYRPAAEHEWQRMAHDGTFRAE